MENKEEIELKPRVKKSFIDKIKGIFDDKKKRGLYVFLFVLPFIIAICVFGIIAYKEAKNVLNLITSTVEVNDAYSIPSMNYHLRDNATDVQVEYFTELKKAVEENTADETTIVGLVGKNYVADFYTWTNKQGQYDIGGMYYVCSEKNETIKYKVNIYQKARDGFYKYFNKYMNEYGLENLLEVESVTVVDCKKTNYKYKLHEFVEAIQTGADTWEKKYDDIEHDCYDVTLSWTYKPNTKLNLSDFASSINLLIIENDGRYEIVEASENKIDARTTNTATESSEE